MMSLFENQISFIEIRNSNLIHWNQKLKSHSLESETQISFIGIRNSNLIHWNQKLKSHSLIFKLLFYTSNIFHHQIYLRIQVKSEILTTQTNQVVSLFEIRNSNLIH